MKQSEWQSAFPGAPEEFRVLLGRTLNDLEEREMKKRTKLTTTLLAAVVAAMLIAGAAFAAERLGVFRSLDSAEPIHPLDGAEAMVATNLGTAENDYVTLTLEEAVYDGQGALVQLRLAPKDPEKYAVLNDLIQDTPEDVYEHETQLIPVPDDFDERAYLDRLGKTAEEAFVERDGVRCFNPEDQSNYTVRRTDGKALIEYFIGGELPGMDEETAAAFGVEPDNYLYSFTGEEREDGSVILWGSGFSGKPMGDTLALTITCSMRVDGGEQQTLALSVTLPRAGDERRVKLVPEGGAELEGFRLNGAEITFTRVRGYLTVDYDYLYRGGDDMGVTFRLYDAGGEEIVVGGGQGTWDDMTPGAWMPLTEIQEIQSLEELPDRIEIEVRVIGEDRVLGRIPCRVAEAD